MSVYGTSAAPPPAERPRGGLENERDLVLVVLVVLPLVLVGVLVEPVCFPVVFRHVLWIHVLTPSLPGSRAWSPGHNAIRPSWNNTQSSW